MFGFGLNVEGQRVAYWGARAIADGHGLFSLLPDRQSWDGEEAPRDALLAALREGLLTDLRAAWARLDPSYNNQPAVTLIDTPTIYAAAQRSYGYVHIGVILRTLPESGPVYEPAELLAKRATTERRKATAAKRKAEASARAETLVVAPYEAQNGKPEVYLIFKPASEKKDVFYCYNRQYGYVCTINDADRRALLVGSKVTSRWKDYSMTAPGGDWKRPVRGDAVWIEARK